MDIFEFLVQHLMAPFIVIFGFIGNILGFFLTLRSNKQKNGLILMYKYLFFTNLVNLIFLLVNYLENSFYLNLINLNKYVCRLFWYYDYTCGSVPSMMLVYISLERIISIKRPIYNYFFTCKKYQRIYLVCLIAYNSVFYLPILFFYGIHKDYTKLNSTNSTQCRVGDYILVLIDLINVLIPAILMSIFTIVLIVSIHRMRTRMLQTFKSESNKVLRKKIQLIVALVSMNISYLVLSLPWNIYGLFQVKGLIFEFLIYLFSISFACNFYFLLAANDYFRNEFFRMIYFKK